MVWIQQGWQWWSFCLVIGFRLVFRNGSGVSLAFGGGVGDLTAPSCISLAFANGVDPARTVVVVSPPRHWIPPGFQKRWWGFHCSVLGFPPRVQRQCGWLYHPIVGFPWVHEWHGSSEDGSGALAASSLDSPQFSEMAVGVSPLRSGVSIALPSSTCPARTAVVLAPPLLAYVAVPGFFRGCAGSEGGSRHLATSHSASRTRRQSPCHRVVVVVVLGTLFSSWRAFAGAGYLSKGARWSVTGNGRCVLTCFLTLFLLLSWLLVLVGCCSRRCVLFQGKGEVVVWWREVVEF
jgi:hypothetical protein